MGEAELEVLLEPFCAPIERRLRELELSSAASLGGGMGEAELEVLLEPFCAPIERRLRELELSSSAATAEVLAKLAVLEVPALLLNKSTVFFPAAFSTL
jgi:hypothetical protein